MIQVSVIVPAYRAASYIGDALKSVLAQTFSDFEIIVINDGCPETEALEGALEPYRARITYLKLDKNVGLASARNVGIRASSAPYIALLDADDLWEPNYLQAQMEIFRSNPALDVVYCDARLFGNPRLEGRRAMEFNPSEGEVTYSSLMNLRCSVCVSVTGKREAFLKAGLFEEGRRRVEDFDLWLRIVKSGGKIGYHRGVLVHSRRRPDSLSADEDKMLAADIEVAEKCRRTMELTPEEREVTDRQIRRWGSRLALIRGKQALAAGRIEDAVGQFQQAYSAGRTPKLAMIAGMARIAPRLLAWVNERRAP